MYSEATASSAAFLCFGQEKHPSRQQRVPSKHEWTVNRTGKAPVVETDLLHFHALIEATARQRVLWAVGEMARATTILATQTMVRLLVTSAKEHDENELSMQLM